MRFIREPIEFGSFQIYWIDYEIKITWFELHYHLQNKFIVRLRELPNAQVSISVGGMKP